MMEKPVDSYRHKGLRRELAKLLKIKGIKSETVLQAVEKVPRHFFLENAFFEKAYEDKAFPIGEGQTISQPFTVAYQTELLDVKKNEKILEIGTGSGYQACILLELGAKVFTIERQKLLHERAKKLLPLMGYHPRFFLGDGSKGLPAFAPFHKIIVTAGAPFVPDSLLQQLKPGGKMVIPVGDSKIQKMVLLTKITDADFHREEFDTFRFVPLLGDEAW